MRMEQKQAGELARRQGATVRTILQLGWLLISGVGSYYLMSYLLNSGQLSHRTVAEIIVALISPLNYIGLSVPTSPGAISNTVTLLFMVIVFTFVMQVFLYIGFLFGSPEGRRRTGEASLYSRNQDPYDEPFG